MTRRCKIPNPASWTRHLAGAALLALLMGSQGTTALEADPARIEFKTHADSVAIALSHDGKPVPSSAVQSVKLYVGAHDYDHMIQVEKTDGRITVRPTPMLELGTYDLAIATTHGEVRAGVLALLTIVDESLEARAARQGVTVEVIKAQLGISQPLGKDRVELNLAELYYAGQALEVTLPVPAGRSAQWSVNGDVIAAEGDTLRYVFEHPGVYDFGYVEKVDGNTVAFAVDSVQVVPEPKVPVAVAAGTALTLRAPDGYKRFTWTQDGEKAGTEASWPVTFEAAGEHEITVRASEPAPGTTQAFRVVTYAVTVK